MYKYKYKVSQKSVDVRHFTIVTDRRLQDDTIEEDIIDAIRQVNIPLQRKTDSIEYNTDDCVNCVITYVKTTFGDDPQIDWFGVEE